MRSLLLAALLALPLPALAEAPPAPPAGFQFYCRENDCRPSGAASVPYTKKVMADISKVSADLNEAIRYVPDKVSQWKVATTSGDCEDIAMAKRKALIKMGYPVSALRPATGWTSGNKNPRACSLEEQKEGKCIKHAVLVVVTSKGKFVLDNRTDEVLPLKKAKIRIEKMASADPMIWG